MGGRFEGCVAHFYDAEGNLLTTAKIYGHNVSQNSIEVSSSRILLENPKCEILIIASPVPFACSGVIHPDGPNLLIKLFKGEERENRRATRYKVAGRAAITSLICEGKTYSLHTPIEVGLVNISSSGVRIRSRFNTLSMEDRFNLLLKIGDSTKNLIAEVVNLRDIERESSEYGCTFVGDTDE